MKFKLQSDMGCGKFSPKRVGMKRLEQLVPVVFKFGSPSAAVIVSRSRISFPATGAMIRNQPSLRCASQVSSQKHIEAAAAAACGEG